MELTSNHKKVAYALCENVRMMTKVYGVEYLGFLTLTFAHHVTEFKEANRCFNNLARRVLKRYREWIVVMERHKSGRIHFHLLVVCAQDIKTGFDHREGHRRASACAYLLKEWDFWQTISQQGYNAEAYGFGWLELLPIKSTEEAIARYLGKYISKNIENRRKEDKGARLVRYSKGACRHGCRFQWNTEKARLWRLKLAQFAEHNGIKSLDEFAQRFGNKWAHQMKDDIEEIGLQVYPTTRDAVADGVLPEECIFEWGPIYPPKPSTEVESWLIAVRHSLTRTRDGEGERVDQGDDKTSASRLHHAARAIEYSESYRMADAAAELASKASAEQPGTFQDESSCRFEPRLVGGTVVLAKIDPDREEREAAERRRRQDVERASKAAGLEWMTQGEGFGVLAGGSD